MMGLAGCLAAIGLSSHTSALALRGRLQSTDEAGRDRVNGKPSMSGDNAHPQPLIGLVMGSPARALSEPSQA